MRNTDAVNLKDARLERYYRALRECYGLPRQAAMACNMSLEELKGLLADPLVQERIEYEMLCAIEALERRAYERAWEGSDQLLMFLLRARKPDSYQQSALSDEDINALKAIATQRKNVG